MTPYRVELIWIEEDMYLFKTYTKDGRVMMQEYISKERIPDAIAQYLCVGHYKV
jgi:hypothetical protein